MNRRPNILFLMTDQMRADVLEAGHPCIHPNLDALAARGVRFRRAYTPNAVCSPARASLMTGLLPHQHGVLEVTHCVDNDQCCLREEHPHWAQRLSEAGYRTGYFGKWHVERSCDLERFGWQINGEFSRELFKGRFPPRKTESPGSPSKFLESPPGYGPTRLYEARPEPPSSFRMAQAVDLALPFLQDSLAGEVPWCCFVSVTEPHDPFICAREDYDRYDVDSLPLTASVRDPMTDKPGLYRKSARVYTHLTDRERREAMACYYASITNIDRQYGRLIDAVERAGQLDNTIVVFTSDHGELLGAHGLYCKNIGAFEEVYRIPMIVAGPGVARGTVSEARVGSHELCPTLLELTQAAPIPTTAGRSFAPVLADPAHGRDCRTGFAEYYGSRFRLTQFVYWDDDWKFVFNGFDVDELYDLRHDPDELHNLVERPEHRATAERLMAAIWRRLEQTGERNALRSGYPPLRLGIVGPGDAGRRG